jgi:predicted HTH transcriptional regulator
MMTEVLFCLSVGFVAYVVYVLVDEQRMSIPGVPVQPIVAIKPTKPAARATKAKSTTVSKSTAKPVKKAAPKADNITPDLILAYLGKNGLTTVAKLTREIPESRKTIEDKITQLIQDDVITKQR